jgi:hypothetical protein
MCRWDSRSTSCDDGRPFFYGLPDTVEESEFPRACERLDVPKERWNRVGNILHRGVVALAALGLAVAFTPLLATSAVAISASHGTSSHTARIPHSTKTPTKCTIRVFSPVIKPLAQGNSYTVNSVACSGDWADVIFTSDGTKQIDVAEYSKSIGVWVPDNTTEVCSKHLVPKSLKSKACSGSLSQAQ